MEVDKFQDTLFIISVDTLACLLWLLPEAYIS